MRQITIQANHKYTITIQYNDEVTVSKFGVKMDISDPDIILSLALIIRDLQDELEVYKNPDNYV